MSRDNLGGGTIPTLNSLSGGSAASTQKAHSPAELSGPNGRGHLASESPALSLSLSLLLFIKDVFVFGCAGSLLLCVGFL